MLLIVYRSLVTMLIVLLVVAVELAATRGVVAVLGNAGLFDLSTYAVNLLTGMAIAAGTDYAIFLVGRYQEARGKGLDREAAYHDMFRGTVHVIVGSGLTIIGAVACLHFTRLPYFSTIGIPTAVGLVVTLSAALTLGPAVVTTAARFGFLDSKRVLRSTGWRRVGTTIVRWPGPCSSSRWRCPRWAYSRCRERRSASTHGPTCPMTPRPTSDITPRNATSRRRSLTPSC
jgi:putative drug exporter of the RND superfamily